MTTFNILSVLYGLHWGLHCVFESQLLGIGVVCDSVSNFHQFVPLMKVKLSRECWSKTCRELHGIDAHIKERSIVDCQSLFCPQTQANTLIMVSLETTEEKSMAHKCMHTHIHAHTARSSIYTHNCPQHCTLQGGIMEAVGLAEQNPTKGSEDDRN